MRSATLIVLAPLSAAVQHHERHILPSSPTASFSLLWRGLSLLHETRTTPRRVLNCRAVHLGQPRMKRGHCLALVDALELLSAADWNILIFHPKCRIRILESKHQGRGRRFSRKGALSDERKRRGFVRRRLRLRGVQGAAELQGEVPSGA